MQAVAVQCFQVTHLEVFAYTGELYLWGDTGCFQLLASTDA